MARASIVCVVAVLVAAIAGVADPLPLAAGVVLVAAFTICASISPFGVIMAIIVALPYFYRPISFGTQAFAASELLLAGLIAGGLAHGAYQLRIGRLCPADLKVSARNVLASPLVWLLAALVTAGMITTFTAFDTSVRSASLREFRWTLIQPLLLVVVLVVTARCRSRHLLLALALIAAGLITSLHGLLDVVTGGGIIGDNVRRLSGPLPHPNALALFLIRPLALAAALAVLVPAWRRFTLPATAIIGIVIFGTFSRGAMIAIAALALMLWFMTNRTTRIVLASSVAGMVVAALVLAGDRMRSALEGGSVSLRLDIWTSAARMIRDSPIVGYGPDQFLYAYAPRYVLPTAWDERFTSHAHNLVFDAWIRLGLFGAVVAVAGLILVTRATIRHTRSRPGARSLQTAAIVALMAVFVHGMIDNAYFGHDLAMSAWVLAWLAFAPIPVHGDDVPA